jgi:hypothetical protein
MLSSSFLALLPLLLLPLFGIIYFDPCCCSSLRLLFFSTAALTKLLQLNPPQLSAIEVSWVKATGGKKSGKKEKTRVETPLCFKVFESLVKQYQAELKAEERKSVRAARKGKKERSQAGRVETEQKEDQGEEEEEEDSEDDLAAILGDDEYDEEELSASGDEDGEGVVVGAKRGKKGSSFANYDEYGMLLDEDRYVNTTLHFSRSLRPIPLLHSLSCCRLQLCFVFLVSSSSLSFGSNSSKLKRRRRERRRDRSRSRLGTRSCFPIELASVP